MMTKKEAEQILDLCVTPDELTEDLFYYEMAKEGLISADQAERAYRRMESMTTEIPVATMKRAVRMVENVKKYGVACAAWCND